MTDHIASGVTRYGKILGQENPSTQLRLAVWLNLHHRAALDARVKDIYTPGSPNYHRWLTDADLEEFAPTEAETAAVRAELERHHLTVTSVDPLHLSVRFEGRASDVESAFHTQVNRYSIQGQLVRTTSSRPELAGAAAGLVQHVAGLNGMKGRPMIAFPKNFKTGQKFASLPVAEAKGKPSGLYFADHCFYAPSSATFTGTSSADDQTPVTGTYSGLTYGADPDDSAHGALAPCGYSPAQVQKVYGLDRAHALGYTGAGQTIVIIDAFLQPTARQDLATFSSLYNLPPLTANSYKEYNPYGAVISGYNHGTDQETDLDLEWAHAIAPGANLALVQAFSDDEEDMQSAALYAVTSHLGNVISFSYGLPESLTGPFASGIFNEIAEIAAAEGISIHAATGDSGDFGPSTEFQLAAPDVNGWFADSPYATSVGGTSVAVLPDGSTVTTGWGNNLAFLTYDFNSICDPPPTEFYSGSGGGISAFFAKPAYQSGLPGTARLLPDVSALADPFTGVEFVFTDPTTWDSYVGISGGTSLATPIFSGIWAIAEQAFGGVALGQAAPYIAAAPDYLINDVLPLAGRYNVTGVITDSWGPTNYASDQLSQPLFSTTEYVSSLWNVGQGEYANLTFGTDTTLTVTQGWDNVTGYGTPNLNPILDALAAFQGRQ